MVGGYKLIDFTPFNFTCTMGFPDIPNNLSIPTEGKVEGFFNELDSTDKVIMFTNLDIRIATPDSTVVITKNVVPKIQKIWSGSNWGYIILLEILGVGQGMIIIYDNDNYTLVMDVG